MENYIKINKDIITGFYFNEKFNKTLAWLYLLACAADKDRGCINEEKRIPLQDGTFIFKGYECQKIWKWKAEEVVEFINFLISANEIRETTYHDLCIITINNFNYYKNDLTLRNTFKIKDENEK